jgi:hypothetical protein
MITRHEYLYAKHKASDLTLKIAAFEANSEIYAMYEKWLMMSSGDKNNLIAQWDQYYEDSRNGYYGLMFSLAKTAFKQNDIKMVKSLGAQVGNSTYPLRKTPSSFDPRDFHMKMSGYFAAKQKQKEYQSMIGEFQHVFETRMET